LLDRNVPPLKSTFSGETSYQAGETHFGGIDIGLGDNLGNVRMYGLRDARDARDYDLLIDDDKDDDIANYISDGLTSHIPLFHTLPHPFFLTIY
jgi:hypothetical protein